MATPLVTYHGETASSTRMGFFCYNPANLRRGACTSAALLAVLPGHERGFAAPKCRSLGGHMVLNIFFRVEILCGVL